MATKKDSTSSEVKSQKSTKTTTPKTKQSASTSLTPKPSYPLDSQPHKTRIIIKYDAGFPNQLYIRGNGANLSWDKGAPLKNVKADEWIWETDKPFSHCEFKVLINDYQYETGENHRLNQGASTSYTPRF